MNAFLLWFEDELRIGRAEIMRALASGKEPDDQAKNLLHIIASTPLAAVPLDGDRRSIIWARRLVKAAKQLAPQRKVPPAAEAVPHSNPASAAISIKEVV